MSKIKHLAPAIVGLFFVLAPSFALAQTPPPVSISTASLPATTMGTSVSDTLSASGGVAPYTWSAIGLPNGVSIDPSTGIVSGTPILQPNWSLPLSSDYSFTAQVQDSIGQITTATIGWTLSPTFTYTRTPGGSGVVSNSTTVQIHGTYGVDICPGSTGTQFQIQIDGGNIIGGGTLSIGQTFDQTITFEPLSYNNVHINCIESHSDVEQMNDSFTVSSLPIVATTPAPTPGVVGQAYSTTLQYSLTQNSRFHISEAAAPYTWSITSGSLPNGLSLDPSTGIISGTPTGVATSTFTAQVTDALGQTSSGVFTISVLAQLAPPSITTVSLPTTTIGTPVSDTLSASGGVAPYAWSATGLPNGVSIDPSTGVISGTPILQPNWSLPLSSDYSFTAQVQDSVGQITTATIGWTILPTFTYVRTPGGSGVVSNSTTVQIHGTYGVDICPGSTGTQFQIQIDGGNIIGGGTLSIGQPFDQTITFEPLSYNNVHINCIESRGDVEHMNDSFTVSSLPVVTTNPAPTAGIVGQAYSTTLQYSLTQNSRFHISEAANPYTWSIISGSLPDGLSLDPSTGIISGTPTTAASSTFTAQVTDALGQTSSATFTISVLAQTMPPSITTTSLPSTTMGTPVSDTLSASGGIAPYTWSAIGLPNGVSVDPSTGIVSGTPILQRNWSLPLSNDYSFTAQVQDSVGQITTATVNWTVSPTFTYTRTPGGSGVVSNSTTVQIHGTYGVDICPGSDGTQFQIQIDGGNIIGGGTLTTGQPFDQTITFEPLSYNNVHINCIEFHSDVEHMNDSFTVSSLPVVTTSPAPTLGIVGQPYSTTLQYSLTQNSRFHISEAANPYTWSLTSGSLPNGLSLDPSTGIISGTPTVAATSTFTAQVTDALGQISSGVFTIHIFNPGPPVITTTSLPDAIVNTTYSQAIQTTGGLHPFSWAITSGTLPTGLSLDPSSGVISGTPTIRQTKTFTVKVTDTNGATSSATYTLNVVAVLKISTPKTLPQGKIGNPYTKTLATSGGTDPDMWSVVGGALPAGLSLSTGGIISGTPTTAGSYSVTIQAADSGSQATSTTFSVKVTSLDITTGTVNNGIVGKVYTKTMAATGGATPYTWSVVDGSLPSGLSLSTGGVISGTPTAAGSFTFTIQAMDVNGQTDTATYTNTITQTNVSTVALPNGKVGNTYTKTLAANGGTAPYTWSVVGGSLPTGLLLSSSGVISGTPTTSGTASVTIQATDANGISDSQAFSLQINP